MYFGACLQTAAPRRESLARATVRYLERKASTSEWNTPAAAGTAAGTQPASLPAGSPACRRHSTGDNTPDVQGVQPCSREALGQHQHQHQQLQPASPAVARHAKHRSDGGAYPAYATDRSGTAVADNITCSGRSTDAEIRTEAAPAGGTPPRAGTRNPLPDWDQQDPQQQQPLQSKISLFHSPQMQPRSRSRRASDNDSSSASPRNTAAGLAAAGAGTEQAALCVRGVGQQQQQLNAGRLNGDDRKAASCMPSFKWQQPQPATTPDKAAGRAGELQQ